jgi:hypothetical protein
MRGVRGQHLDEAAGGQVSYRYWNTAIAKSPKVTTAAAQVRPIALFSKERARARAMGSFSIFAAKLVI